MELVTNGCKFSSALSLPETILVDKGIHVVGGELRSIVVNVSDDNDQLHRVMVT